MSRSCLDAFRDANRAAWDRGGATIAGEFKAHVIATIASVVDAGKVVTPEVFCEAIDRAIVELLIRETAIRDEAAR